MNVEVISFVVTISLFILLKCFFSSTECFNKEKIAEDETIINVQKQEVEEVNIIEPLKESKQIEEIQNKNIIGKLIIPTINLEAHVAESVTQEIISKYIGHFSNTNNWEGNIGLAAHNRRI